MRDWENEEKKQKKIERWSKKCWSIFCRATEKEENKKYHKYLRKCYNAFKIWYSIDKREQKERGGHRGEKRDGKV